MLKISFDQLVSCLCQLDSPACTQWQGSQLALLSSRVMDWWKQGLTKRQLTKSASNLWVAHEVKGGLTSCSPIFWPLVTMTNVTSPECYNTKHSGRVTFVSKREPVFIRPKLWHNDPHKVGHCVTQQPMLFWPAHALWHYVPNFTAISWHFSWDLQAVDLFFTLLKSYLFGHFWQCTVKKIFYFWAKRPWGACNIGVMEISMAIAEFVGVFCP